MPLRPLSTDLQTWSATAPCSEPYAECSGGRDTLGCSGYRRRGWPDRTRNYAATCEGERSAPRSRSLGKGVDHPANVAALERSPTLRDE